LIAGDIDAARTLSERAAQLGRRIGEPDWSSVADSQLWEIVRFTDERGRYAELAHNGDTINGWVPWRALGLVADGRVEAAADLLRGFDLDRGFRPGARATPEPWAMAIVAEAVAAAGTRAQREELYERLTRLAGLHVITGGCVAYGGAFDHYLGLLAAALGHSAQARHHFAAAVAMHERVGASAWIALSRRHQDQLLAAPDAPDPDRPIMRRDGDTWTLSYAGRQAHLPDRKGLHDLATLITHPGRSIHVVQLLTGRSPGGRPGADAVLDADAKAAYRRRLTELDTEMDDHDPHRAERARLEREALLRELAAATGLGGRDRRLGDTTERARKTVTSRIRDAIARIRRHHPDLAAHLDASVSTGAWCCYAPAVPARTGAGR
jgi:hypothetical protein